MLPTERRQAILTLVRDQCAVRAEDLAQQFEVSVETVRRDLRLLASHGLLERVYGGASTLVRSSEGTFEQRRVSSNAEKRAIGALAAGLLEGGETILIDVGTTCQAVARAIAPAWYGRVITNSVPVAVELAERPLVDVLLSGGWVRGADLACAGSYAARVFDDFNVSVAFVGSGGVHPSLGLTDYHASEAELRREWLAHAGQAYILADSSKLGEVAPCRVAPLDSFAALVTDDGITATMREEFERADLPVHVASVGRNGARGPAS